MIGSICQVNAVIEFSHLVFFFSPLGKMSLSQVYIAEISPAHLRGMLGGMYQVAISLGILLAYVIGYFLLWNWLALVGCFPAVLLFVLMFFMPESPRWYLEKNRKSDALQSLLWLRESQAGIEDECREIEATLGKVFKIRK